MTQKKVQKMEQKQMHKLRVLSLFSGCGGMDIGLEGGFLCCDASITGKSNDWIRVPETRFETVFANDILKDAKTAWTTYFSKKNRSEDTYHLESIVDLVKRHQAGENIFPDNIDVVTGGFPCQDFSVAGKRLGFDSNKNDKGEYRDDVTEESRGKLYFWMKQVIDIVKPKLFIAENVKGLVSMGNAVDIIRNDFAAGGYFVAQPQLLKAWEYGVPETRERVIFIGVRKDCLKDGVLEQLETGELSLYPDKTHGDGKLPIVTCRDVLCELREPEDETIDLSQMCYSTAKYLGKGKQGQAEINYNGLGPTIRSEHHGNIEFRRLSKENGGKNTKELEAGLKQRRLTPRECALIQTFPIDYEFVMKNNDKKLSMGGAYKIIGNAVPPVLAYKIAVKLQNIWDILFY